MKSEELAILSNMWFVFVNCTVFCNFIVVYCHKRYFVLVLGLNLNPGIVSLKWSIFALHSMPCTFYLKGGDYFVKASFTIISARIEINNCRFCSMF